MKSSRSVGSAATQTLKDRIDFVLTTLDEQISHGNIRDVELTIYLSIVRSGGSVGQGLD